MTILIYSCYTLSPIFNSKTSFCRALWMVIFLIRCFWRRLWLVHHFHLVAKLWYSWWLRRCHGRLPTLWFFFIRCQQDGLVSDLWKWQFFFSLILFICGAICSKALRDFFGALPLKLSHKLVDMVYLFYLLKLFMWQAQAVICEPTAGFCLLLLLFYLLLGVSCVSFRFCGIWRLLSHFTAFLVPRHRHHYYGKFYWKNNNIFKRIFANFETIFY